MVPGRAAGAGAVELGLQCALEMFEARHIGERGATEIPEMEVFKAIEGSVSEPSALRFAMTWPP